MNDSIHLSFTLGAKNLNKDYQLNTSMTVRQVIEQFLKDTNSIMKYTTNDISFSCNSKILNKEENLDKPLSKVLTKSVLKTGNAVVKIYETIDIIGGK